MIVRRALASIQHTRDGTILASFLAIDDKGREWRRSRSRFANEAEAQAASNAFDWNPQLRQKELADSQENVESGKLSSLRGEDYKQRLTERLREIQNRLNDYIVVRDRLQAELDRVNG